MFSIKFVLLIVRTFSMQFVFTVLLSIFMNSPLMYRCTIDDLPTMPKIITKFLTFSNEDNFICIAKHLY